MKYLANLVFIGFCLLSCSTAQEAGIEPYPRNPSYWQYNGEPMLLLGGSDDDNLYQWTGERLMQQIDALVNSGGNYLRCTMSYRDEGNVKPWVELENGKYDLSRFDDAYWERFKGFLDECNKRDIIVQVEVWATYDYLTRWEESPFCPVNNINYAGENTRMPDSYDPGEWPGDPGNPCPFYHTIPGKNHDELVLSFQQAYVDKLLSISLEYNNILYCIDNEIWVSAPLEWGWYWSHYIKEKAQEQDRKVYVTEMYCFAGFDIRYGSKGMEQILGTLDHPEIYDYLDISNTGMFRGEYFYRQIYEIYYRLQKQERPRPVTFVKIYGNPLADYDLPLASGGAENFWIALTSGMSSARFHRPPTGIGISGEARKHIRAMRKFEQAVKPWECSPRMDMTLDNFQNEAYLIANPGKAYGIYFPKTGLDGVISVDLSAHKGKMTLQWLDLNSGTWQNRSTINGGDWHELKVPGQDSPYGWAAVIVSDE